MSFIDAQSGELLNVHNEVRFLEGSLHAAHDTRTVDGNVSESPLYRLRVDPSDSQNISDTDGSYLLTEIHEEFPVVRLESSYTEIINDTGGDAQLTLSGGEQLWQGLMMKSQQQPLLSWTNMCFRPPSPIGRFSMRLKSPTSGGWKVNVNINDVCNAYF